MYILTHPTIPLSFSFSISQPLLSEKVCYAAELRGIRPGEIKEGTRIHNTIYKKLKEKKEFLDLDCYNGIFQHPEKIHKIIRNMHKETSESQVGENFQLLIDFIFEPIESNEWYNFDIPLTIFAINYMSLFFNIQLLSDRKTINDFQYAYFFNPFLISTFRYIYDSLYVDYQGMLCESNVSSLEDFLKPIMTNFLKTPNELYTAFHNDSQTIFDTWSEEPSKNEIYDKLREESQETYMNIYNSLSKCKQKQLDLDVLCNLLSQTIMSD